MLVQLFRVGMAVGLPSNYVLKSVSLTHRGEGHVGLGRGRAEAGDGREAVVGRARGVEDGGGVVGAREARATLRPGGDGREQEEEESVRLEREGRWMMEQGGSR